MLSLFLPRAEARGKIEARNKWELGASGARGIKDRVGRIRSTERPAINVVRQQFLGAVWLLYLSGCCR